MRIPLRYLTPLAIAGGAAAAILAAPTAAAAPPLVPTCVQTEGGSTFGGSATECATPGNAQITATPPTYAYPWSDEYYGPALMMGGW